MKKLALKIGVGVVLVIGSLFVQAQTGNPIWTTSKDVQKVANKNLFRDKSLKNTHINAASIGYPDIVLSKDVTKIKKNVHTKQNGNILSKGYPMWTVSKGVHTYKSK